MPNQNSIPRRRALQVAGVAAATALAGCFDSDYGAGAREDRDPADAEPEYGEWFEDARGYEATIDSREDDAVTILVGAGDDGFAYDPAAVAVSPGTEITFEWTGEGGAHNVEVYDGPADIGYEDLEDEAGFTHTATVDEDDRGITRYFCTPHEAQGMKGAVVVADPDEDLGEFVAGEDEDDEEDVETYDGWLDDVEGYEGPVDATGEDSVTVDVGAGDDGLAFDPIAVRISPGTTVVFEWTGEGGAHNVVTEEGPADLESELVEDAGHQYEFEFTDDHVGATKYVCEPHVTVGMIGVVEVVEE